MESRSFLDTNVAVYLLAEDPAKANCAILYTEDMQHNQRLGKLRVCNPFLADTAS